MPAPENLHRPADHVSLAREARVLAELGLSATDIASALDLHPAQVRRWIAAPPAEPLSGGHHSPCREGRKDEKGRIARFRPGSAVRKVREPFRVRTFVPPQPDGYGPDRSGKADAYLDARTEWATRAATRRDRAYSQGGAA